VNAIRLEFEDQSVRLKFPASLRNEIEALFGQLSRRASPGQIADSTIVVEETEPGLFSLQRDCQHEIDGLDRNACLLCLAGEVVHALIVCLDTGVVLHAGAVTWNGNGILLPGSTGAGKSCLSAWLASKGFNYLTDECVVLHSDVPRFTALPRPLVIKDGNGSIIREKLVNARTVISGPPDIFWPENTLPYDQRAICRFIVFPHFAAGEELSIEPLGAAEAALQLTACNVNARNLPDHGLAIVKAFAREVPAIAIRYGSFDLLEHAFDAFLKLMAEGSSLDPLAVRRALALIISSRTTAESLQSPEFPPRQKKPAQVPAATPRGKPRKLTIGMATCDDYDGVYFSLQALRMYHPEIVDETEFLVIDNNPEGSCAEPLKALERWISNYRYVPYQERSGTSVRDHIFEEASGEFVVCMDCHVFVVAGALKRLLNYFDGNCMTADLLQGPLVYDGLNSFSTHFEPGWRKGMYGTWVMDDRGKDPNAPPFDIPMQGLGLFACRRAVWPGFNPRFRGFGGEEGYIHEKFRRAGGRTLCLPFLRWLHRFNRPLGTPYVNTWDDRIRNYMIGHTELGIDLEPLKEHFVEFLGPRIARPILQEIEAELAEDARSASLDWRHAAN
jgi:hypothetical protein